MKAQFILLGASAAVACAQRIDYTVGPFSSRLPTVHQNSQRHLTTNTTRTVRTTTRRVSSSLTHSTTSTLSIRPIPEPIKTATSTLSTSKYSNCLTDSIETYFNYVYPTVYSTTDETVQYTVTVSGANYSEISYPRPAVVIETPLEACSSTLITTPTIIPTSTRIPSTTMSVAPTMTDGPFPPPATSHVNKITSTVIVTRKTSVPIVFRTGGSDPNWFDPHVTMPSNGPVGTTTRNPGNNGGGPRPDDGNGSGRTPTQGNGNITPASPPFQAAPFTTSIPGVVITIQPTAVVIGSTTVILPAITATLPPPTVVVNGETYTIKPSEIVGPHTTLLIPTAASTITQAASTVTAAGLTFTIGPSYAIVSGTTYRLGPNVPPMTLIFGSETITLNSKGLILPSSTFVPPMTLAIVQPQPNHPIYKIVVVDGMTISIDASEAIISGTTFGIGSGFTENGPVTRTVDGRTITLDDARVIVGSQTITATGVQASETEFITSIPKSEASPSLVVATETGTGEDDDGGTNAGSRTRESVGLLYSLLFTLWAAF